MFVRGLWRTKTAFGHRGWVFRKPESPTLKRTLEIFFEMKQKEVLIGRGLSQSRITLSGRLAFNKRNPCRARRSWMHTFRGSLMSRLCLVDPSRNCPSSTDPSWAFWHQILYVKMQIWHWSSTRGAALYLSEACLLLAISAQGSYKKKSGGTRDQHARWWTCICTAHFEKGISFKWVQEPWVYSCARFLDTER